MAVIPVNVARVSNQLRSLNLLRSMQASNVGLFRAQTQLSTGLRFQTPSEDPVRAAAANRIDRHVDVLTQVNDNLRSASGTLRDGEAAMQSAVDLIRQAHTLSVEAASDGTTPDEREALVTVIDSILEQAVAIGNQSHLGSYLFSGNRTGEAPFEFFGGGVRFNGDAGRREAILDSDLSADSFTISGQDFFNAASRSVEGIVDLSPQISLDTRLSDLDGATRTGIDTGRIRVSDGAASADIDLGGAATIGDVLDRLNAEMPASLQASLGAGGIEITSTVAGPLSITVIDLAGGATAAKLGIVQTTPLPALSGADLNPRLTPRTELSLLSAGLGVDVSDSIVIRVGSSSATVDFDGAETIEDLLNRINQSGLGVRAEISADGKHIDVRNLVSGADLHIEEDGGTTASNLGIRSMHSAIALSELNDGLGVTTVAGDDVRIVTRDGTATDIDLDSLNLASATIQDVIDLLNTAGGGRYTAALASVGNGIVITDNTAGAGALRAERLNLSPALDWLGLDVQSSGGQLVGRDVNPVRADSPFTALIELKAALAGDDANTISSAAQRLERGLSNMQRVQGELAAKAATIERRTDRIADESTATQVLRSDTRDADMTETIVKFQQLQTALEANMQTASRVLSLSLMDYLR